MSTLNEDVGPKQLKRQRSYNENVDEPAKRINDEPTDIEHEIPADETEPVEQCPKDQAPAAPVFEG